MFDTLSSILERRPSLGWIGSLFAALPGWMIDAGEMFKVLGLAVAFIGGLFTAMIQIRNWWRGRKLKA